MAINSAYRFPALTADGNTASIDWPGGRGVFAAWGTFGGGTYSLQWSPDDSTYIGVDRSGDTFVTFTANGEGGFELGPCKLRGSMSGSTAPNVNAGVQPVLR